MADAPSTPQHPAPIVVIGRWFLALWFAATLGYVVWFVFQEPPQPPDPPFPPPGPVDPVDPDDDDIEPQVNRRHVELAEAAANQLNTLMDKAVRDASGKKNRVNLLRLWIPRDVGESFSKVSETLAATRAKEFASVSESLATGYKASGAKIQHEKNGVCHEHVGRCCLELARNHRLAARAAPTEAANKDFHEHLQQVNYDALVRMMDGIISTRAAEPNYGYRIDDEAREQLEQTSKPLPELVFQAPAEIDPRGWHRIENQSHMGSCQGHANSSVCEFAYYISSREVTQFSPLFAYYNSQKVDNIQGSDCGSTIAAGLASAKNSGSCPLEVMPYPRDAEYRWGISQAAYEAARPFKIERHVDCRNYSQVFNCLASGQGGVEIGIRWGNGWMQCNGVLEHFDSSGGGGHAVCFLGYSTRKDRQGRNYLWLANSWGTQWGNKGWAEVSPVAVDEMFQHQDTVMICMSDMKTAKVRDVSWIGHGAVYLPKQSMREPFKRRVNLFELFSKELAI